MGTQPVNGVLKGFSGIKEARMVGLFVVKLSGK